VRSQLRPDRVISHEAPLNEWNSVCFQTNRVAVRIKMMIETIGLGPLSLKP